MEDTGLTLFGYKDKNYDFDDFVYNARRKWVNYANANFGLYYKKHRKEYDQAFDNIMNGIASDEIWYDSKRGWYDSKGRYTNSDHSKKPYDPYGCVVTYLSSILSSSDPYLTEKEKAEEKKLDWDEGKGLDKYVYDKLFGTDDPNDNDWDALRDATDRRDIIYNIFRDINFADTFKSLDADKVLQLNSYRDNVLKVLEDNVIDENERYALRLLSRSFAWDKVFGETSVEKKTKKEEEEAKKQASERDEKFKVFLGELHKELLKQYPYDKNKMFSFSANPNFSLSFDKDAYNKFDNNQIKEINLKFENNTGKYGKENNFTNGEYLIAFAEKLVELGLMDNDDKVGYLFPDRFSPSKNIRYTYDPATHTIGTVWVGDLEAPNVAKSLVSGGHTFIKEKEIDDMLRAEAGIPSEANGGHILKLLPGGQMPDWLPNDVQWTTDPGELVFWFDAKNLPHSSRLMLSGKSANNVKRDARNTTRATNKQNDKTKEYDYKTIEGLDDLDYRKWWVDLLTTNRDLAALWAADYYDVIHQEGKPNDYYKTWFKEDASLNNKLSRIDNFDFDAFKKTVTTSKKPLWFDNNKVSIGYDEYKAGTYYIKDPETGKIYYTNTVPKGYTRLDYSGTVEDNPLIDTYELVKNTPAVGKIDIGKPADLKLEGNRSNDKKDGSGTTIEEFDLPEPEVKEKHNIIGKLQPYMPTLLSAIRLGVTNLGNRKARDIAHVTPALHEVQRHVNIESGDQPAYELGLLQAAAIRDASRFNYTSDATLNALDRISREIKANAIEEAAFLKDSDKRIATAEETKNVANYNADQGVTNANANIDLIKAAEEKNKEIDVDYIKTKYGNIAEWLKEQQQNVQQYLAEEKSKTLKLDEYKLLARLLDIKDKWQLKIDQFNQQWKAKEVKAGRTDTTEADWIYDQAYAAVMRRISTLRQRDMMNANIKNSDNYIFSGVTLKDETDLANAIADALKAKHGGRLIPRKWRISLS